MNRRLYRNHWIAAVTLCAALPFAGCDRKSKEPSASQTPGGTSTAPSGQEAASQKKALVRFAQDVSETQSPSVDLWFGDMKVFSNVGYKQITPYVEVPAERHDFKIQRAGETQVTALATSSEGLAAGGHYTIVAERHSAKDQQLALDVLKDDLSVPATGKSKLRVVNATVGLGKIDMYGPDGKLFTGIGERSSTSYKDVPPTAGTIEVRRADKKTDVLRITKANLQAGKIYTIVVSGGSGAPIESVIVADQQTPPVGVGG